MSDSEFEGHKRSLITKRLEKLKNLDQESSRHWSHIVNEHLDFELVYDDAAQIKLLSKLDMTDFVAHYIDPSSTLRSKLAIHLNAQTPKTVPDLKTLALNKGVKSEEDGEVVEVKQEGNGTVPYVVTDVREFKSRLLVSAGPEPIRHVSEFEESVGKL